MNSDNLKALGNRLDDRLREIANKVDAIAYEAGGDISYPDYRQKISKDEE